MYTAGVGLVLHGADLRCRPQSGRCPVVGAVAGVRAAAIYSVAQRLGLLPVRIVSAADLSSCSPRRVSWRRATTNPALREITDDVVRFVQYLSIPAAIALGFLAGPTVEVWVGPVYREAAPVVGLLCLAGVVQAWAWRSGTRSPARAARAPGSPLRHRGRAPHRSGHRTGLSLRRTGHGRGRADRRGPDGRGADVPVGVPELGDSFPRRAAANRAHLRPARRWSRAASPGWSGAGAARSTSSRTRTAGSPGSSAVAARGRRD